MKGNQDKKPKPEMMIFRRGWFITVVVFSSLVVRKISSALGQCSMKKCCLADLSIQKACILTNIFGKAEIRRLDLTLT
jgi:hypothetical protein